MQSVQLSNMQICDVLVAVVVAVARLPIDTKRGKTLVNSKRGSFFVIGERGSKLTNQSTANIAKQFSELPTLTLEEYTSTDISRIRSR